MQQELYRLPFVVQPLPFVVQPLTFVVQPLTLVVQLSRLGVQQLRWSFAVGNVIVGSCSVPFLCLSWFGSFRLFVSLVIVVLFVPKFFSCDFQFSAWRSVPGGG